MNVTIDEARRVLTRALHRLLLTPTQRARIIEQLLYAEIHGKRTHGLARVPWLLKVLDGHRHSSPTLLRRGSRLAQYDASRSVGYLAAEELTNKVVRNAKHNGAAAIACRNVFPSGVLGCHVAEIAQHGLVGCALATTPALVSMGDGGKVLGTNPIAVGYRASDGRLFLVDVSCAPATFGHLMVAMWERQPTGLERFRTMTGRRPDTVSALFASDGTFTGSIESSWSNPLRAKLAALSLGVDVVARCFTGDGSDRGSLVLIAAKPESFGQTSRAALDQRLSDLAAVMGPLPGQRFSALGAEKLDLPSALWDELLGAA